MRISETSIQRPVTTLMIMLIIIILDSISFWRLNVDLLPNIQFPIAVVITEYEGAGPQEVEGIVTQNIERAMATVSNLAKLRSISSSGSSLVILEFNQGTNLDFVTLEMREKIDLLKRMLPDGVSDPMVMKMDPNMMPIMSFGVYQENQEAFLHKVWVEDVLKPRLERIEGVASVNISGGRQQEIKVIVSPEKLALNGLTMQHIASSLRMENLNLPGGIVSRGQYDLLVRTSGEFKNIEEIKDIPIFSPNGSVFILKDIAEVEEGFRDIPEYSKINGQDSIYLSIQKESTANTVKVAQRVNNEIEKFSDFFPNLEIVTVFDQSKYINRSILTVARNVIIGGLLAIIVLFLFLRNFRPILIISTAIPISIIATFIFIYFAGITLNMISLGGLALGVGMLIDNSIVVLENIFRLGQTGLAPREAAIEGSAQVSNAITASTLTTIRVFLPIFFVEGVAADIFRELALTVSFSMAASLMVALTLVPMLCSGIISKDTKLNPHSLEKGLNSSYHKLLKGAMARKKLVIVFATIVFAGSLIAIPLLGAEFFPAVDQGQIDIQINMARGTNFEETLRTVQEVEDLVKTIPEVETITGTIGSSGMNIFPSRNGAGFDTGNITLILKPTNKRDRSAGEITEEIRTRIARVPGCEIEVDAGDFLIGGLVGGTGAPLTVEIKGEDMEVLREIANDIKNIVEKVQGTREVRTSFTEGLPELTIRVDKARASQLGINLASLSAAVQSQLQGLVATRYKVAGREVDIRVQTIKGQDIEINDLERILVASPMGMAVPLYSVAKLEYQKGPVRIEREDQTRVAKVYSQLINRDIGSVVNDVQDKLKGYDIPSGYIIDYAGEDRQVREAFENLGLALILGVILVYMVMASQFESLAYPFVIMFTLPLAFTGAFIGLLILGKAISVPAYLGMIMLAGIVVNNGIVLVDYINKLREEGKTREESILEAGPTRLRPILMTTITTILGLMPLALGIGDGTEIQVPLAITVIGGLTFSTILTLIVLPVIYTYMDDLASKIKSWGQA